MTGKSSNIMKLKAISNTRKKATDPSTKLKKNTIPISKCQDRIKMHRQNITTKQKCPQEQKKSQKSLKEDSRTKDVNKVPHTTARKTKVVEEKRSAYFQVDLLEKELRSIFKKFPAKLILRMPGIKKNRMTELRCKIAAYETKKRKIMKIISQAGRKKAEADRTASILKKMKEKKIEKSMKRKARQNAVLLEQDRVSEYPIAKNKSKHFWEFTKPLNDPAANRIPTRSLTKKHSSLIHLVSPKLHFTFTPLPNELLPKNCNKLTTSTSALEYTSCLQESGTLPFSKKRRLIACWEKEMKNRALEFVQVSSAHPSNKKAFSMNTTPKKKKPFESLKLQKQEIKNGSLENQKLSQSLNQTYPDLRSGEVIKTSSFADGCRVLDSVEIKGISSSVIKPTSVNTERSMCSKEGITCNESDSQKRLVKRSITNGCAVDKEVKITSTSMTSGNKQEKELIETLNDIESVKFKNGIMQHDKEKYITQQRFEELEPSSFNLKNLKGKSNFNRDAILPDKPASSFTINQSTLGRGTGEISSLLQQTRTKIEPRTDANQATNKNYTFSKTDAMFVSYKNGFDSEIFDKCNSQALKEIINPESLGTDFCLLNHYSNRNQQEKRFSSKISAHQLQMSRKQEQKKNLSEREKLCKVNFDFYKDGALDNWKISEEFNRDLAAKIKSNFENKNSGSFSCKIEKNKRTENKILDGLCDLRRNKNKETIEYDSRSLKPDLLLRSNTSERTRKKMDSEKDNTQNVSQLEDLSSVRKSSTTNLENLQEIINVVTNRTQQANFNTENSSCYKNINSFEFSTPIYNYVDLTRLESDTTVDSSNNSEDIPPLDNCTTSNSELSFNYQVLKTYLTRCGLLEPPGSVSISKNMDIINHTPKYELATSEESSEELSESRSSNTSSDAKDSSTIEDSSSRSASQKSSCDSCLLTSSSTDDEENVKRLSLFGCNTLRLSADNNEICEEYCTNSKSQESDQTSFESISSRTSTSSSAEEPKDADTKTNCKRKTSQRQSEIEPFVNGSMYWLKRARCMRENYGEQNELITTRNYRSKNSNSSSNIQNLLPFRLEEKGEPGTSGKHFREKTDMQQDGKMNSKKLYAFHKIEAS